MGVQSQEWNSRLWGGGGVSYKGDEVGQGDLEGDGDRLFRLLHGPALGVIVVEEMVVKTQLLVLPITGTWGGVQPWARCGPGAGGLSAAPGCARGSTASVPLRLCAWPATKPASQSLILARPWASLPPCAGPSPSRTQEPQEEQRTQQSPCHPVWSLGYSELGQASGGRLGCGREGGQGC